MRQRPSLGIRAAAAAALGLAVTTPSVASRPMIWDTWPLLAFDRDGSCELTIAGNGKTLQIAATGLLAGERARLRLSNAGIKPLDWPVLSDRDGTWSQVYLPFLWGEPGGTVRVTLEGSTCRLSASVPWTRTVRVIR